MDLTISIVSWNTRDLLDACLKSVYDTTSGIEFEVIVVDNASTDGTPDMIRDKYPQVTLVENKDNVGFARANNQAFGISSGEFFMLLNPDTICRNAAISRLVQFLGQNPCAGAVGPLVLNPDGTLQHSWARFPRFWGEVMGKLDRTILSSPVVPATPEHVLSVGQFATDWVSGCCLLIRAETVRNIGPMDETFFMYSEETDWCMRLARAGFEVWVEPASEIIHFGGESSKQMPYETARLLRQSKAAFFAKHYGSVQAIALRVALEARAALKRMLVAQDTNSRPVR